jgi:ANTAR domain
VTGSAKTITLEDAVDVGIDDAEPATLARTMVDAGKRIAGARGLADAMTHLVTGAVDAVPGVEAAGVAVRERDGSLVSRAQTTETAARLDRAQLTLVEGPCIDAITGRPTVLLPDARIETRWPRFVPQAVQFGMRASLSVRLAAVATPVGSLNLHATGRALGDERARTRTLWCAWIYGSFAALALSGADRVENLERGVASRDVIGQAKGILMNRFGLEPDQAFDRLRRASQHTNIKLVDVAAWVVAKGAL